MSNLSIPPPIQPPSRTPGSGTVSLWAHLLQKDLTQTSSQSDAFLPPAVPTDKTGTSMRILLHDTQANFERFTHNVNKLMASSEAATKELILIKSQFEREHEGLSMEMADLVNRSQTETKKSIGSLQQSILSLISTNRDLCTRYEATDKRLDSLQLLHQNQNQNASTHLTNLEKRLDALQLLFNTQAQTIQNQNQLLQSLNEQNAALVPMLSTLLPLVQALPTHIESSRSMTNETLLQAYERSSDQLHLILKNLRSYPTGRRKRALSGADLDVTSPKRLKVDPTTTDTSEVHGFRQIRHYNTLQTQYRNPRTDKRRVSMTTAFTPSSPAPSNAHPIHEPIPQESASSRMEKYSAPENTVVPQSSNRRSSPFVTSITTSSERSPKMLRAHTSSFSKTSLKTLPSTSNREDRVLRSHEKFNANAMGELRSLRTSTPPLDRAVSLLSLKSREQGAYATRRSLQTLRGHPIHLFSSFRPDRPVNTTPQKATAPSGLETPPDLSPMVVDQRVSPSRPIDHSNTSLDAHQPANKPIASFCQTAPQIQRSSPQARRPPFKEGKRFIPLVDSDDE